MSRALLPLLLLILAGLGAKGQTVVATYTSGDISTLFVATEPTNTTTTTCPGTLSITIPAGNWVTGMTVAYNMTTASNGWREEQRSYLYSPTLAAGESTVAAGVGGSGGTYNYSRNPTFANGAMGTFSVELRAFRTFGSGTCNTTYNKVDNNTWVLTVSYGPIPTCMAVTGLGASAVQGTTANLGWTAPTTGTTPVNYIYELRTSGAAGSGATGLVTSGVATTNAQPLASLNPVTAYTAYVRSNCGGGDSSSWASTTFTTTQIACSGQPVAGTVTGAAGSYNNVNFTLGLSANSSGITQSGTTVQWQRSATGLPGSWANVTSGTNATVTTSQTVSNYYRAYVTCTAAALSDTTPAKLIRVYCLPTYTTTSNGYRIENVTFGTINNTTANNSVTDFTNLSNDVVAAVPNNISTTTHGYTGSAVAADLNNDGDFADADEILFPGVYTAAGPPETNTYAITIPGWVPTGSYRLRVFSWGGNSGGTMLPCGTGVNNYGSFRDYTVNVTNNATCLPPTALNTSNLQYASLTLGWTAATTSPTNYEWKVMLGNDNPNTGIAVASGTVAGTVMSTPVTGLVQNTAYKAYVRSVCNPGDNSVWSSALSFTTPYSCLPVTGLSAGTPLSTSANLTWTAPASGNTPVNYVYELRTSGAAGSGVAGLITTGTSTTTSQLLSGLIHGTAYTAYVRSNCGSNDSSSWANVAFTTPLSCYPVTGLDITAIAGTNVTFGWTAPTQGNPVVNYQYELRTSGAAGSGATGLAQTGFSATNSQLISGLVSGTSYTFYVRSDCNAGRLQFLDI